jgi:mannose-1-phosphate guanylyltransferase/phosphomannomutase
MIDHLAIETSRTGANLGVYVDNGGQRICLISPEGQVVRDEYLLAVTSLLFAESFGSVYLPSDAPLAIERFAGQMGKEVMRTRAATGEFMNELVMAGEWEQLRLYWDGFYLTGRLLELMARLDASLDELLAGIPMFFYDKRELPISWKQKGRVIRRLAETSAGNDSQSLEGIRLWNESGSSLILPDEDRPVCRIYSEAFSQEIARSLSEFCIETIKKICQEEE